MFAPTVAHLAARLRRPRPARRPDPLALPIPPLRDYPVRRPR
jgi:hypothetical protein